MGELIEECVAFFKRNPGYQNIMEALLEKWRQYGRVAGRIVIDHPAPEETEALRRFMGKDCVKEGRLVFNTADFEKALGASRFAEVPYGDLLSAYFKKSRSIPSRKQEREDEQRQRKVFLDQVVQQVQGLTGKDSLPSRWAQAMAEERKYGYKTLLQWAKVSEDKALKALMDAAAAVSLQKRVKEPHTRLAVLAAKVTGNPHALDRKERAGLFLLDILAYGKEMEVPSNAEGIMTLYADYGLVADDQSNFSIVRGLDFYTEEGLHPGFAAFRERRESLAVTLSNLDSIVKADCLGKEVFVVENQMLFSTICDRMMDRDIALMCSSGQVNMASLMIMDMLVESGCRLRYSGDLDPAGLVIAQKLIFRYPKNLTLWHMEAEDYERIARSSPEGKTFTAQQQSLLQGIQHPAFTGVVKAMKKKQKPMYQELLLEELVVDLMKG